MNLPDEILHFILRTPCPAWVKTTTTFAVLAAWCTSMSSPVSCQEQEKPPAEASISVAEDSVRVSADTTVTEAADVHPQDSPEGRGFLLTTADGRSSLRIRGSIRIAGLYDFKGLQTTDVFSTFDIPVGAANRTEPRFFMDASQTRLGLEATRNTEKGDAFLRIEGDFRGRDNSFRLRHAYGSWAKILVGQTWSLLCDVSSLPNTVDFEGPNSAVVFRTPQIRFTANPSDASTFAVSAEVPEVETTRPDTTSDAFQGFADLAVRFRHRGGIGHFQLSGTYRSLTWRDSSERLRYTPGYGLVASGMLRLKSRSQVLFQAVYGRSISRFITAFNDKGLDLIYNPNTQELETLVSGGGYLALSHRWNDAFDTNMVLGLVMLEKKDFSPADFFLNSQYIALNVFWKTISGTRVGIEYLWGRRENIDGGEGDANRFQFAFYYDF